MKNIFNIFGVLFLNKQYFSLHVCGGRALVFSESLFIVPIILLWNKSDN